MENENDKETITIDYKGYKNQKISIKDMPSETFELIAVNCGLDVAVSLLKNMCGLTIFVPSNGFEALERRIILDEYAHSAVSIKKLALKLNLTEKTVRTYIAKAGATVAAEGQQNLFPEGWQKNVES